MEPLALGSGERLADADLTFAAVVEARGDRHAGVTNRRVIERVHGANGIAGGALRTKPDEGAAARRQLATTETIAAVGRERSAVVMAGVGLSGVQLAAGFAGRRDHRVGAGVLTLTAVVRLGVVVGRRLVGVALVAPIAVVVAGAGVLVEVAVDLAGRSSLPWDTPKEAVFGVVTRAEAIGIL